MGRVTLSHMLKSKIDTIAIFMAIGALFAAIVTIELLDGTFPAILLVVAGPALVFFALKSIRSARFRLYLFVGFGMLIMQSESGGLGALKPIYFILVAVFGVVSVHNVKYLTESAKSAFRPVFLGSSLLAVLILAYIAYSVLQGELLSRVVRDAFTYVLVAISPFIGADAARESTIEGARIFVATATGLAALSFAVYWLAVRQVSILGVERLFMFSMMLSGLGVILGFVYGLSRLNAVWLGFGLYCLIAVLVTGTRSGLLLVFALLATMGARRKLRISWTRIVPGFLIIILGAYLLLPSISAQVSTENFLESRMRAFLQVVQGGIESDASGQMRQRAMEISLSAWRESVLLGGGFGQAFQSVRPGEPPVDFQLDSGFLILAKFGIFGSIIILISIGLIYYGFLRFHKKTGLRTQSQTIFASFAFMTLMFFLLGVPMEDKGFAYSLCLIAYLLVTENVILLRRQFNIPSNVNAKNSYTSCQ